jgi:hypothetical protein
MIPLSTTGDIRDIGQKLYFEYHCFESHESQDAELWYRSHQLITIIGFAPNDGWDMKTRQERNEAGHPIVYEVEFTDGFIGHALEDELLDNENEYCRPDPPSKQRKRE